MNKEEIRKNYSDMILTKNQYWATVRLKDGGLIRVIKIKNRAYPKGY